MSQVENSRLIANVGYGISHPFLSTNMTEDELRDSLEDVAGRLFEDHRKGQTPENLANDNIPGVRMAIIVEPGDNAVNGFHRLHQIVHILEGFARTQGFALGSTLQEVIPGNHINEAFEEYGHQTNKDWVILSVCSFVDTDYAGDLLNDYLPDEDGDMTSRPVNRWIPITEHLLEQDREKQRRKGLGELLASMGGGE